MRQLKYGIVSGPISIYVKWQQEYGTATVSSIRYGGAYSWYIQLKSQLTGWGPGGMGERDGRMNITLQFNMFNKTTLHFNMFNKTTLHFNMFNKITLQFNMFDKIALAV